MNIITSQNPSQEHQLLEPLYKLGVLDSEIAEILEISNGDLGRLRRLITRKAFGEPNAYLRGYKTLLGRQFAIDRRCYISDVESELMVRDAIANIKRNARVLEVGTGCGWIAASLALERPDLKVFACDIDPGALSLAAENHRAHNVEISLFESYFADDVPIECPDVIIANIPYGGDANYTTRELEERPQMPPIALFDPAGVIKPLQEFLASLYTKNWSTKVYLETGYLSLERLSPLLTFCSEHTHYQDGEYGWLTLTTIPSER